MTSSHFSSKRAFKRPVAASFGIATLSIFVASEIQSEIVDITWNGGNSNASAPYMPSFLWLQDIDQVPNLQNSYYSFADFGQWNDVFNGDISRQIVRTQGFDLIEPMVTIESMRIVEQSELIDPMTFVGEKSNIGGTEFDGSGSAFVAVRPVSAPGNLYWFRLEYGLVGSPIFYSFGQYGSDGEALVVNRMVRCDQRLGDVNRDGLVNLEDISPFVKVLVSAEYDCTADINTDLVVDLLDVEPFVQLLAGQ